MPPKKHQTKRSKPPTKPKQSSPKQTTTSSSIASSTSTPTTLPSPLAPTSTTPPQDTIEDDQPSPSPALLKYREDKLMSSYLLLHEEYYEIQSHIIDPNTVVEREDLRAIDPYAPLVLPHLDNDTEEIPAEPDSNSFDMNNLMAMMSTTSDGQSFDFINWDPHADLSDNLKKKDIKPTIPIKKSHQPIKLQIKPVMQSSSQPSIQSTEIETDNDKTTLQPTLFVQKQTQKPRTLQLDLGLEFDLIAALDVKPNTKNVPKNPENPELKP